MFSVGIGWGMLRPLALITPVIAGTMAAAGWSRTDVRRFLFEHNGRLGFPVTKRTDDV